ncbi:toll/interleukin-1 receptor domain-containing protein [Sphaerisporangium album]|uniref:Toll/interleukin-1 receptor domain-containing protein n=1 Tax=Sphaerisporangium album TaxID=509200 RepID=A0A367FRT8_9ACTN|nr:toll/interleukin-1 receptor domain-containing protein [Sphaerisporangium album]RCG33143.1 toll/interleukin-1 receptor domain-containing protein [Sphaerisporangium album]
MHEIFINYRTGDGDKTAAVLDRELSHRFGEEHVFRASKSIRAGRAYAEELINGVRSSAVVLVVIGQGWSAHPALHDENDWVRREILEAYASGTRVIPIIEGRKNDRLCVADLPAELARIAEVQSLRLDLQKGSVDLVHIGDELTDYVPALKKADRRRREAAEPGTVNNTAGDVHGPAMQSRDITGDVSGEKNVITGTQGPVHTGKGDINQNTTRHETTNNHDNRTYDHRTDNSRHYGTNNVSGENQGGIHQRFDFSGDDED